MADAWGDFEIKNNVVKITVCGGEISLKSLGLKFCDNVLSLKIDGKNIDYEFKNGVLYFEKINISNGVEIVF